MNPNTGSIHYFLTDEDMEMFEQEAKQNLVPISEAEAEEMEPMTRSLRLGKLRNKPCFCGSGKKFKRCCIGEYE